MRTILTMFLVVTSMVGLQACSNNNVNAPDQVTSNRSYSAAVANNPYMFRSPPPAVMNNAVRGR